MMSSANRAPATTVIECHVESIVQSLYLNTYLQGLEAAPTTATPSERRNFDTARKHRWSDNANEKPRQDSVIINGHKRKEFVVFDQQHGFWMYTIDGKDPKPILTTSNAVAQVYRKMKEDRQARCLAPKDRFPRLFKRLWEGAPEPDIKYIYAQIELAERKLRRIHIAHDQQESLFRTDKVQHLRQFYSTEQEINGDSTHLGSLSSLGTYILEEGQPAKPGIPGYCEVDDVDYLTLDVEELALWLRTGTSEKVIVYRNRSTWNKSSPRIPTAKEHLRKLALENQSEPDPAKNWSIDVQDLATSTSSGQAVHKIDASDVYERWNRGDKINCLNLEGSFQSGPSVLTDSCDFLSKTIEKLIKERRGTDPRIKPGRSAGKNVFELPIVSDIASCKYFDIIGAAWVISGWHIDQGGVWTYATVQDDDQRDGIKDAPKEHDVLETWYSCDGDHEVHKLWAIVVPNSQSGNTHVKVLDEFKKYGLNWKPPPSCLKVISLIRGDTLVMPPGTIHAPITVTNCHFTGGMLMQQRSMKKTLEVWAWLVKNFQCTNESVAKQTRAVADAMYADISKDVAKYGFRGENASSDLLHYWRKITGGGTACTCGSTKCAQGCSCVRNTERCGMRCHPFLDGGECKNPWGCHLKAEKLLGISQLPYDRLLDDQESRLKMLREQIEFAEDEIKTAENHRRVLVKELKNEEAKMAGKRQGSSELTLDHHTKT